MLDDGAISAGRTVVDFHDRRTMIPKASERQLRFLFSGLDARVLRLPSVPSVIEHIEGASRPVQRMADGTEVRPEGCRGRAGCESRRPRHGSMAS
jgi:hypothetical protein